MNRIWFITPKSAAVGRILQEQTDGPGHEPLEKNMTKAARTTNPSTVHELPPGADVPPPFVSITELAPDPFIPLGDAAAAVLERLAEEPADASKSGAGGFIPVARNASRTRLHARHGDPAALYPHPLGLRSMSLERDIFERTNHLVELLKRETHLAHLVSEGEHSLPAAKQVRREASLHRTVQRILRLTSEVADTHAPTLRAAAAKADLYIETSLRALAGDPVSNELALSISHDVLNLTLEASCMEGARDGHLLDLIEKHGTAAVRSKRADDLVEALRSTFTAARPPLPEALYWKGEDALGVGAAWTRRPNGMNRQFYDIPHVAKLRERKPPVHRREVREPAPWGNDDVIVRVINEPDPRHEARVAEIIAAADDLMARTEALANEVGLTTANEEADAAANECFDLEIEIMNTTPVFASGWVAKARWLADKGWSESYLGELALRMVKDIATMPHAPERQRATPREVLEAYRTFLHFELRELNLELDGDPRAKGFWMDNPAGHYHFGKNPKASTRAATVLGFFGLLPATEDEPERATAPAGAAAQVAA